MLNSLKKPATTTKKTLTPAERAEAVAAAVAAAQAAQAAKKAAAAKTAAPSKTTAKTNGKDTKAAAATAGATNGEAPKEEGDAAGADDKDDEEEEKETEKGQSGEAKAAMKNMTGYHQENERDGVDSDKIEKAMSSITDMIKKQKADKAASGSHKEAEKLTLAKEDIEVVMNEFDLTKALAEKHLKEHGGDLIKTLDALVTSA
ncbi:hypothetical protein FBU30_000974 [Linnemannia zychae]|nr:hypothetical protein FBU30_000974 [Linnemannia zychae]